MNSAPSTLNCIPRASRFKLQHPFGIDPVSLYAGDYPISSYSQLDHAKNLNRAKLSEQAGRLADQYKLDRQSLQKLLFTIALSASDVRLRSELSAKSTRAKITKLRNILGSSLPALKAVAGDEAACHALKRVSGGEQVPFLVLDLGRFLNILNEAADVPTKRGRGAHPVWRIVAARFCKAFWRKQRKQKPTVNFGEAAGTTEPISPFSCWFCEMMSIVDPTMTASECNSVLRQK
jgi:hypothetical protein